MPWKRRLRNTGVVLPKDVNPQSLFNKFIGELKALRHNRIQWLLGYSIVDDIPHIITPWQTNGNIRDYLHLRKDNLGLIDRMEKVM